MAYNLDDVIEALSFGGFTSPKVSEGIYTVVIKKGKDVFENNFELI